MAKNTRRLRLAGLTLALSLATIGLTALPANAVGCYGDYCSGKDPVAMGCDRDAYAVVHNYLPSTWVRLQLIWSPTCKTNWARVAGDYGRYYPWALKAIQRDTGYTQAGVSGYWGEFSWSRMIYSPRLCVYASWQGPPGPVGTACA